MSPQIAFQTQSDYARAAEAGVKARQRLADSPPPSLRRDVIAFADSGLPQKAKVVTKWLESRGVYGAVGDLVRNILKHQNDVIAARVV